MKNEQITTSETECITWPVRWNMKPLFEVITENMPDLSNRREFVCNPMVYVPKQWRIDRTFGPRSEEVRMVVYGSGGS